METAIVAIGLIVFRQVCELIAKTIPDHASGWRAGVRRLFKALALYIPNKR